MIKMPKNILPISILCALYFSAVKPASAGPYDKCIGALANDIADTIIEKVDVEKDVVILSSDMLIEFFVKNIDLCRDYLLSRESPDKDIIISDEDLIVDVRWDYVLDEVAAALSTTANNRQLFVCENNRGWQAGIDAALWATTAISAIFSFGTSSVAISGTKAAVTQGAKNLVKVGISQGTKVTAKEAAVKATAKKLGSTLAEKEAAVVAADAAQRAGASAATIAARDAAVTAAQQASRSVSSDAVIAAARQTLLQGTSLTKPGVPVRRVTDSMLRKEIEANIARAGATTTNGQTLANSLRLLNDKTTTAAAKRAAEKALQTEVAGLSTNLATAQAALTAERAAAQTALANAMTKFAISTPLAALGGVASVYSFLSSKLDPKVMNCKKTNANSKCYLSCNKDTLAAPADDLTTKVFKPILGKNLCIDEDANFVLREISGGLPTPGNVLITTNDKWEIVKQKIISDVQDKGNCDWKINDIDMYVAAPLYDPATLEPVGDGSTGLLIDAVRIDD